jgi:DNA-binding IclR family transcriptional regulator
MLAFAPPSFRARVLSRPLQRFTDKTIVSPRKLENELQEIVRLGYASAPEEVALGLNAVAAPVFDAQDNCIATIALVGSIQFLPEKPRLSDVSHLVEAARQISRKLGHDRGLAQPAHPKRSPRGARVRHSS